MGRTMIATAESWDRPARESRGRRKHLTRAERRARPRATILADNFATEDDLEFFLSGCGGADAFYAAGLPELARWTAFRDQHYRPQDLDQVAEELVRARTTIATEPWHLDALIEAEDVVRLCRANGWHLSITVD